MKDIIITPRHLKKQFAAFLICFAIAFILNIIGIVVYKTAWSELLTSLKYVFIVAFVLYIIVLLIRLIIFTFKTITGKRKK